MRFATIHRLFKIKLNNCTVNCLPKQLMINCPFILMRNINIHIVRTMVAHVRP